MHGAWSVPEVHPAAPPPGGATVGPSGPFPLVYDSKRHRALGLSGDDRLWILQLERGQERWESVVIGAGPGPRNGASVVYDPFGDRLILYGGGRQGTFFGDLWALDLDGVPSWTPMTADGAGPGARAFHAATVDLAQRRMLVHGGSRTGNVQDNDTWALTLEGDPTWTLVDATGQLPSPGSQPIAHYDAQRNELIVIGDQLNNVWVLSLQGEPVWRFHHEPSEYPSLNSAAAVLDTHRDRLVSFGGSGAIERLRGGMAPRPFELSLGSGLKWNEIFDLPGGPPPRQYPAVLHDPVGDRMITFGGWNSAWLDDTWALEFSVEPGWRKIAARPLPRKAFGVTFASERGRLLTTGGGIEWTDVFEFRAVRAAWSDEAIWGLDVHDDLATWNVLGVHPAPRWNAHLAVDEDATALLALGGYHPSEFGCFSTTRIPVPQYPGDALRFSGPGALPLAEPFTSVFFHEGHHIAIDRSRNRLLVHGGQVTTAYCDIDIFEPRTSTLLLDRLLAIELTAPFAVETLVVEGPGPGGRAYRHAFYDDDRDRMILFDGVAAEIWSVGFSGPLKWELLGIVDRTFGPEVAAVFDPVRERIVVLRGGGALRSWSVSLDGTTAELLPAGVPPVATHEIEAAYDRTTNRIVVHGPGASDVAYLTFGPDGPVAVVLSLASAEAAPDRVRLEWHGAGAGALSAKVERRSEGEHWRVLGVAVPVGADRLRFEDTSVSPNTRYAYRLFWVEAGREQRTQETWVEVPPALELALEGFRPNPARAGAASIAFTLPDDAPASVELLDIAGRRVARYEASTLGAGRHVVPFASAGLSPGVYMIRLVRGDAVRIVRGVVTR